MILHNKTGTLFTRTFLTMRLIAFILALFLSLPARAEPLRVVTDLPPVHALVSLVMGDTGTPELLLTPGADPHHFQLRPSQARTVARADLVIWVGPDLTPWLARVLAGADAENAVALGGDGDLVADHDHDHGAEIHQWLDPAIARDWIAVIAQVLAKADPDQAQTYHANAAEAVARIDQLQARLTALLTPARDLPFIVGHDAYDGFAQAFGLTIAGSIAESDAAAPGAARLADLRHVVRDAGVICLFPEAQSDPSYLQALAQDSGVRMGAALDPAGATLIPGPDLYAQLMTRLAQSIADCLLAPEK